MVVGISKTSGAGRYDRKSTCAPLQQQVGDARPSHMALDAHLQATEACSAQP